MSSTRQEWDYQSTQPLQRVQNAMQFVPHTLRNLETVLHLLSTSRHTVKSNTKHQSKPAKQS